VKVDAVHVGLKRAGSTLLRAFYEDHPRISWSREGTYFLDDRRFEREKYEDVVRRPAGSDVHVDMHEHLAVGMRYSDEERLAAVRFRYAADDYPAYAPIDRFEVARRIRQTVPEAKIVLVLRNQIDWLGCHYRNFYTSLEAGRRAFPQFLNTHEGRLVADAAAFDRTVATYLELFGASRVRVLLLEDMSRDLQAAFDRLCDFLAVPRHRFQPAERDYHRGQDEAAIVALRAQEGRSFWRRLIGGSAPAHGAAARDRHSEIDLFSPAEVDWITGVYGASNARLARLLDRDVSAVGYRY
jgi:hypothetical protein